nr:hypothetical protein GCM10020092_066350 [Actinoplanes digitatis]
MRRLLPRSAWPASRPYLIVLALNALIVSQWFRTGTFIAGGDMGAFIRRGWAPEATWAWNHQTTGTGSAGYTMARGFEFVLIYLCRAVGLTEYSAQWLFYICIYGLVGFGVAYLARRVRAQPGGDRDGRRVRPAQRLLPNPAAEPAEHHLGRLGRPDHRHRDAGRAGPSGCRRRSPVSR